MTEDQGLELLYWFALANAWFWCVQGVADRAAYPRSRVPRWAAWWAAWLLYTGSSSEKENEHDA